MDLLKLTSKNDFPMYINPMHIALLHRNADMSGTIIYLSSGSSIKVQESVQDIVESLESMTSRNNVF